MAINRRQFVCTAVAAGAAAVLPSAGILASTPVPTPVTSPPVPAWAVGTPGEWDWLVIHAPTAEKARAEWASEQVGGDGCEVTDEMNTTGREQWLAEGNVEPDPATCECDWCSQFRQAEADRQPTWDGKEVPLGGALWCEAGLGAKCSRCDFETFLNEGAHMVDDCLVCDECMTLADWRIIDPERAAELDPDAHADSPHA